MMARSDAKKASSITTNQSAPMNSLSDARILLVAGVASCTLPAVAAWHLNQQLDHTVEPALSAGLGEVVSIGAVEASLTGALTLHDVSIGGIVSAEGVEASVGLDRMLAGDLMPDELRVAAPQVRTRIDRSGELRLRQLLLRARAARRGPGAGGQRRARLYPRRIVVTRGQLRLDIEDLGAVRIHDLAIHPRRGGARLVSGPIELSLRYRDLIARGQFARSGADITWPELGLARALATRGAIDLISGRGPPVRAANTVIGIGADGAHGVDVSADLSLPGAYAAPGQVRVRGGASGGLYRVRVQGNDVPLSPLASVLPAWLVTSNAIGSGEVVLSVAANRTVSGEAELSFADVAMNHRHLAGEPVVLAGHVRARGQLLRGEHGRILRLEHGALRIGQIDLTGRAQLGLADRGGIPTLASFDVTLPEQPCAAVLAALPEAARRRLAGMAMRGTMSGRVAVHFAATAASNTDLDLDLGLDLTGCRVTREASGADPAALLQPFRHTYPNGSTGLVGPGAPGYVTIDRIPGLLERAFILAEDSQFLHHRGFDLRQIKRSLAVDLDQRRPLRGGSTITQQLAKNLFLSQERTVVRKLQEAVLTWRLESRLTKPQILELYLNIIELGEGVFGVAQAGRYWFGKGLRAMTPREIAFLAVLTPAPRTISRRVRRAGALDQATARRVDRLLGHMRAARVIGETEYQKALHERPTIRAPRLAED
jgi:hypothetical protein